VNGSEISSIGNVMYASHALWLVVTGFILLLAMVGTIAISLKPKSNEGIVLNDKNLYKSSSSPPPPALGGGPDPRGRVPPRGLYFYIYLLKKDINKNKNPGGGQKKKKKKIKTK